MSLHDLVGIIGVICYLAAYAGLQLGHLRQNDLRYTGLNILGPVCLLYSLVVDFNLAAAVTQVLWLLLTLLGLAKAIRARSKPMPQAARGCVKN